MEGAPLLSEQISSNRRKSWALFIGFLLCYAVIGWAVSLFYGDVALIVAMVIASVLVIVTLWMGDDLAVTVAGGRQVKNRSEHPLLFDAVETMSIAAGIDMPRVYVSPDRSPNAFAAGRTHAQAIVCVNQGLLDTLDKEELEGVIAHEIAHIQNYDVRLMTYAAVLAGSLALISEVILRMLFWGGGGRDRNVHWAVYLVAIVGIILAPIAAMLIQMAISRRREFLADASAAELTRYPQGLASALRRISSSSVEPDRHSAAIAHMYFAPAISSKRHLTAKAFSTHPPTEERLERLDALAGGVMHTHQRRVFQDLENEAQQAPPGS